MLALPYLSGDELVAALETLGFRTRARAAGLATMCRFGNAVVVPETATLSPALVAAILRTANVEPFDFARACDARAAREAQRRPATSKARAPEGRAGGPIAEAL
jgi:hypothetical protein